MNILLGFGTLFLIRLICNSRNGASRERRQGRCSAKDVRNEISHFGTLVPAPVSSYLHSCLNARGFQTCELAFARRADNEVCHFDGSTTVDIHVCEGLLD